LKRIQQALDQFEASEENLKSAGHISVSIEVYKRMLHGDGEARKRKPWEIAYIKWREDAGLKNKPDGVIILSAGSLDPGSDQASGRQSTAALQAQIGNTVGVMRESINRVSLRGARLSSLSGKGDSKDEVDRLIAQRANEVALLDGQPRVDNGFNPSATNKPAVQDQINDTVRLMRENIDKISQRGGQVRRPRLLRPGLPERRNSRPEESRMAKHSGHCLEHPAAAKGCAVIG
jgi:vesicle-associated membrane protein 4